MIARAGSGWQTVLADLSLILFMTTAATLAATPDDETAGQARTVRTGQAPSPASEPVAIYRPAAGAPPLSQWLAEQSPDARQRLTIVGHYAPGGQAELLSRIAALANEAGTRLQGVRIVAEPGTPDLVATLAYDAPPAPLAAPPVARGLQGGASNPSGPETRP
jgi:hypothetical protein